MMRKSKPRTPLVVAAFSLSSMMFLHAAPAWADCGGGPLSTSGGNLLGSAVGGAAGGLLGNQMGRGTGKGVMTGVGVVGGALAGGYVGRSMEGCGSTARQPTSAATPSAYRPAAPRPRTASSHVASEPRTCRYVATQSQIDGREQQMDVVACLGPDGTWRADSGAAAQQAAQADLVLRAQQRLRQDGFYVRDNIDGQWGPATSAAVSNFQRTKGLPSTGQLDVSTRAAMGLDSALVAASPVVPTSEAGQVGAPSVQATQVKPAQ